MNPMRSLAGRLAAAFAVTATLLLTGAALVQYRTLLQSLAREDDGRLREKASDWPGEDTPPPTGGILVRRLSADCRVLDSPAAPLPPPVCRPDAPPPAPRFATRAGPTGKVWRTLQVADPNGGTVEFLLDQSFDRQILRRYEGWMITVTVAASLLSAVLGYLLVGRGLRPLHVIADRMSGVTATSLDQRIGTHGLPAEVVSVAQAFDGLLGRLDAAFAALSAYSAELAHELRTPLQLIRGQAEIALRGTREPEEYREVIASNLEELDRLAQMVDGILFLARAEDPRACISRRPLDARTEMVEVMEYLDALASEAGVTVTIDAPQHVTLQADRALVRRALTNLLANAVRHTPRGGRVVLQARQSGEGVVIAVEDTGEGIKAELLDRVFDRYVRDDTSGLPTGGGVGLGLAIVRAIMNLHAGTASITSRPGSGTRVELAFPPPAAPAPAG